MQPSREQSIQKLNTVVRCVPVSRKQVRKNLEQRNVQL